jgi:hypothetical protein
MRQQVREDVHVAWRQSIGTPSRVSASRCVSTANAGPRSVDVRVVSRASLAGMPPLHAFWAPLSAERGTASENSAGASGNCVGASECCAGASADSLVMRSWIGRVASDDRILRPNTSAGWSATLRHASAHRGDASVPRGAASGHRAHVSLTTRVCVWTHRRIVTDDPTDCQNTDRSSPLTPVPFVTDDRSHRH